MKPKPKFQANSKTKFVLLVFMQKAYFIRQLEIAYNQSQE